MVAHDRPQISTGPWSRGYWPVLASHKFARGRGPMVTRRSQWDTNLHSAEAPWPYSGHGRSQICTAPKPRGRKVVTAGNKFARCQGPMVTRRSQWDTNLHSAEAPWPYSGHIGKQLCTAPRPRGRHTVTMDHKFARRLGPVVTRRPQRVTNSHGARAP